MVNKDRPQWLPRPPGLLGVLPVSLIALVAQSASAGGLASLPLAVASFPSLASWCGALFWASVVILIAVEGALVLLVIRAWGRGSREKMQLPGNSALEVLWAILPAALLAGLVAISCSALSPPC